MNADVSLKSTDGEKIMEDYIKWTFPRNISIEEVSEYVERLKNIKSGNFVTFDLTKTVLIHSSFIGFLIHAKHYINKINGRLAIELSLTVEKILVMLDLYGYFSPDISSAIDKKTA